MSQIIGDAVCMLCPHHRTLTYVINFYEIACLSIGGQGYSQGLARRRINCCCCYCSCSGFVVAVVASVLVRSDRFAQRENLPPSFCAALLAAKR